MRRPVGGQPVASLTAVRCRARVSGGTPWRVRFSTRTKTTRGLSMDSLTAAAISPSSSTSPLSIFSLKNKTPIPKRPSFISFSNDKNRENDTAENTNNKNDGLIPLSLSPLSKDAAMGLVLNAAAGSRGWTTGSGMEGPPMPAPPESGSFTDQISTFPWSLFTKSPRRRMLVAFTCNVCGQRTTRAINPHAYTDGTVFVQCCGCNVFHKLVDNLNLFHEIKCYVNPSFNYKDLTKGDMRFKFVDMDSEEDDDGDTDAVVRFALKKLAGISLSVDVYQCVTSGLCMRPCSKRTCAFIKDVRCSQDGIEYRLCTNNRAFHWPTLNLMGLKEYFA
ncbi:hypothetical protein ACLOJK_002275 [Asimina triloba]